MIGRERRLERYVSAVGESREIVSLGAAEGSRLIVDRRHDGADGRLLAHLAADEPDVNANLVCADYLAGTERACRPLRPRDRQLPGEGIAVLRSLDAAPPSSALVDPAGAHYRLAMTGSPCELRWQREQAGRVSTVSARYVVAALQDYEPVCELTRAAIRIWRRDRSVSVATLGLELRRLEASPIVLNRRLREAVLRAVRERGLSLSAIAIACGREKRDPRGNGSGETSWLLRRVGLAPDRPQGNCNPWVHSDTLALIARDGLGIAPREVELG
jgi:hypothetical protein